MTKRELSKYEFDVIDESLRLAQMNCATKELALIEELRELFAKAHTGWLEIEEVD